MRDKAQIATKVGLAWKDGALFRDSRPARIRKEIEDSLRRLRTDHIDLYQVHWPDLETPIAETARTLKDLSHEGKIRAIGVSNYSPTQMDAFRAVAGLDAVLDSQFVRQGRQKPDVVHAATVRFVGPTPIGPISVRSVRIGDDEAVRVGDRVEVGQPLLGRSGAGAAVQVEHQPAGMAGRQVDGVGPRQSTELQCRGGVVGRCAAPPPAVGDRRRDGKRD